MVFFNEAYLFFTYFIITEMSDGIGGNCSDAFNTF